MGQTSFIAHYWEMLPVRAVLTSLLKTEDSAVETDLLTGILHFAILYIFF